MFKSSINKPTQNVSVYFKKVEHLDRLNNSQTSDSIHKILRYF